MPRQGRDVVLISHSSGVPSRRDAQAVGRGEVPAVVGRVEQQRRRLDAVGEPHPLGDHGFARTTVVGEPAAAESAAGAVQLLPRGGAHRGTRRELRGIRGGDALANAPGATRPDRSRRRRCAVRARAAPAAGGRGPPSPRPRGRRGRRAYRARLRAYSPAPTARWRTRGAIASACGCDQRAARASMPSGDSAWWIASMAAPSTAAFSAAADCTIARCSVASGIERV